MLNKKSSKTSSKNLNVSQEATRKPLLSSIGVAIGIASLVAVPGLALAAPPSMDSPANSGYQLSYNADELKSLASAKALHLRIRRVALNYCPDYSVTKNLSDRADCIEDVESDLVSQVNNPLLTKIHSGDVVMTIAGTNR